MTLKEWLETFPANPDEPDGLKLLVVTGVLNSDTEKYVLSSDYGLPFVYLLSVTDAVVQRYDNGAARWLRPRDIVFEALESDRNERLMWDLRKRVREEASTFVTELEPGVKMAGRLLFTSGLPPEVRQKGLLSASLRCETHFR